MEDPYHVDQVLNKAMPMITRHSINTISAPFIQRLPGLRRIQLQGVQSGNLPFHQTESDM